MMFIGSLAKKLRTVVPEYVVVTWDGPHARQWRQELYPPYKANRPDYWEDSPDLRLAQEFCRSASIRQLTVPGFEADDLLAAVQRHVVSSVPGAVLVIVSDDHDLLQLTDDDSTIVTGLSFDQVLTASDVETEWGVPPWWLPALRAMAGDESDNIPGLPGIGPARAAQVLRRDDFAWPPPWLSAHDKQQVTTWRAVMELIEPPKRPEHEDHAGMDFFRLHGRAEWHREDTAQVLRFLGKYQLSRLAGRLSDGRLW
jgi:5'-3' exonuclease